MSRKFVLALSIFMLFVAVYVQGSAWAYATQGELKVVVVLVEFTDTPHTVSMSSLEAILQQLNDYVVEVSYGSARLTIDVKGWYVLPYTMGYYGYGIDYDDSSKCDQLIEDAVDAADPYVDFQAYDHVIIVHAGPDEAETGNEQDIWSFAYMGPIGVDTDEGYVEIGLSVVSESSPLGTFAHEFGHSLGLPDLYGYGGEAFVGPWGVMAEGSWNGAPAGSKPAHMMAWSKIKLGWLPSNRIMVLSTGASMRVELYALELNVDEHQVVKVPLSDTRYYLIEVRAKLGFDEGLPDEGVLVTLCDDSLESGEGIVRVRDANPSTATLSDAAFDIGPGETTVFDDPTYRLTVTLVSKTDHAYLIDVVYRSPDLTITSVSATPEEILAGDSVVFKAMVENIGNEDAGSFKVYLYIDGSLYHIFQVDGLEAGSSVELSAEWTAEAGSHEVLWVVDALGQVAEGNEANNEASFTVEVKVKLLVKLSMEGMEVKVNGASYYTNASGYVELHLDLGLYEVEVETPFTYAEGSRLVFTGWLDGVMDNPRPLYLDHNVELEALYAVEHLITVVSDYGSPTGGGWFREGEVVEVSVASPFYHGNGTRRVFLGWSGDLSSTSTTVEVLVDGPKTLMASWKTQYLCSFIFKDVAGAKDIPPPSWMTLTSNQREEMFTEFTDVWVDRGEWVVEEVMWHGVDVKPTPAPTLMVYWPTTFTLNCKVYDLEVRVQDLYKLPVEGAEVAVTLSNGNTVTTATGGGGVALIEMIPCGNYTVEVKYLGQVVKVEGHTSTSTRVQVEVVFSIPVILSAASIIGVAVSVALYLRRRRGF